MRFQKSLFPLALLPIIGSCTNTTSVPACATPSGPSNFAVHVPDRLANTHYYPSFAFNASHFLLLETVLNIDLPEAAVTRYCLERCIEYAGPRVCRSVFVNLGRPYPPGSMGSDDAQRYYCAGFDAYLSGDVYRAIDDAPDSFLYGFGVNRGCGGSYRAF